MYWHQTAFCYIGQNFCVLRGSEKNRDTVKLLTLICTVQHLPLGADLNLSSLDYYVAVYLPGHFFHLLNIQHPDLICHSLFLTGMPVVFPLWTWSVWVHLNVNIYIWGSGVLLFTDLLFFFWPENSEVIDMLPHSPLQSLSGSLVLDSRSGKLYRVLLNQSYLVEFLRSARLDCERMALLHCALSHGRDPRRLEAKVGIYSISLEICRWTTPDVYVSWLKWTEVRFIRWQLKFIVFWSWLEGILPLHSAFLCTQTSYWEACLFFSLFSFPYCEWMLALSVTFQGSAQENREFLKYLLFLLVCMLCISSKGLNLFITL